MTFSDIKNHFGEGDSSMTLLIVGCDCPRSTRRCLATAIHSFPFTAVKSSLGFFLYSRSSRWVWFIYPISDAYQWQEMDQLNWSSCDCLNFLLLIRTVQIPPVQNQKEGEIREKAHQIIFGLITLVMMTQVPKAHVLFVLPFVCQFSPAPLWLPAFSGSSIRK